MIELPLEVIQHIVTVSAPRPETEERDRSDFLRPLCLLHPSCARFIQCILFAHPVVHTNAQLERLLDTVELDEELADCVKSLRIKSHKSSPATDVLRRMFLAVPEIEEVYMVGAREINLAVFAHAKKLRSLSCVDHYHPYFVPFAGEPTTFPLLVRLHLAYFAIYMNDGEPGPWITLHLSQGGLFDPLVLPSLRQLNVHDTSDIIPDDTVAISHRHLQHTSGFMSMSMAGSHFSDLLSLQTDSELKLDPIPTLRRRKALVAIRYRGSYLDAIEKMEAALEWGLIDCDTVIFLRDVMRGTEGGVGPTAVLAWAERRRIQRVEFADGDLEVSWKAAVGGWYRRDDDDSPWDFARWVDEEAGRRALNGRNGMRN